MYRSVVRVGGSVGGCKWGACWALTKDALYTANRELQLAGCTRDPTFSCVVRNLSEKRSTPSVHQSGVPPEYNCRSINIDSALPRSPGGVAGVLEAYYNIG